MKTLTLVCALLFLGQSAEAGVLRWTGKSLAIAGKSTAKATVTSVKFLGKVLW